VNATKTIDERKYCRGKRKMRMHICKAKCKDKDFEFQDSNLNESIYLTFSDKELATAFCSQRESLRQNIL